MPKGLQLSVEMINAIFLSGGGSLLTSGIDLGVNLYIALHTAAPSNNQTESECTYGGYARVAAFRDFDTFDYIGSVITLLVRKSFPVVASGSETATHWSIGVNAAGTSFTLYYDELSSPISIGVGVIPYIDAGTTIEEI